MKPDQDTAARSAAQEELIDLALVTARRFTPSPTSDCFRFLGTDGVVIELWREEVLDIGDHLGLNECTPIFDGFKRVYHWAREHWPDTWVDGNPVWAASNA
ncbi:MULTISPECIES: hypothetical protein [unclassified Bradyrhizobium]|uniref:hypothetical protein n=1 Tax=unclassified Bradyrhizobium TaxID=2631580 RepID=UPI000708E3A2|nr:MULTISPECIES: hypothetical protein [unclassified Bradyrhizobium]KQT23100.1 hypothetical protein ASG57_25230 [Bradyrhizobium sp. Leaf396]